MKKFRLKNAALNWPFLREAYENFSRETWPQIENIPGFLAQMEAFFLYETARNLKGSKRDVDQPPAAFVVEIGSHKGRSTVAIGLGLKANPHGPMKLICVDPFFDTGKDKGLHEEFLSNIARAGLDDRVICLPTTSAEAVKAWNPHEGIALLWIDGNHEYEFVRDDFLQWGRYLVPGGVVALHDLSLIHI